MASMQGRFKPSHNSKPHMLAGTLACIKKRQTLRKLLTILTALVLLNSCSQKVDQETVDNLDRYKSAKDVLLRNFENIKEAVEYQYYDSVRQVHFSTITQANRYFFENTICKENDNLKGLLKLWDDGLIVNEKVFGTILINRDSIIIFTTDYDDGFFSGVGHYVVYNPTNKMEILGQNGNEILVKTELEKHWIYIVEKKYYWDD
jgi:hypothetical protein